MRPTYLNITLIFWLAVFLLWATVANACDALPCAEETGVCK